MKQRFALLTLAISIFALNAYSQTSDAEADAVVNLLGVQKKEAVSKLVPVSGKDSVTFWKIYDEYQALNKKHAKDRIKLYEGTVHAYASMNPKLADSLASRFFANRMDQEKILEVYYGKIKAATNPIIAFEFYQAETFILTQIRANIMRQIPTYGQLIAASRNK